MYLSICILLVIIAGWMF